MHIVLDLDYTLICNVPEYFEGDTSLYHLGVVHGQLDIICLRPHTIKLLEFCKEKFESVHLCSYSSTHRVKLCVKAMELDKYLNSSFGYDCIVDRNGIGPSLDNNFLLIDDYNWDSELISTKLKFFGFSSKNACQEEIAKYHIPVKPFEGSKKDRELVDIIKILKQKLKQEKKTSNA